jgi:hypothetical protein
MTNPFAILAEARIRDWQRCKDAVEVSAAPPEGESAANPGTLRNHRSLCLPGILHTLEHLNAAPRLTV